MPMGPRTSSVRQWSETLASSIGSSGRDDELGRNSWKKIYPPGRVVEGTMGLLMWGAVAGAVLNIVLTALLASVYARNARKVPTMFTAGLLTFRSEEHTSELQSLTNLVCRLLL